MKNKKGFLALGIWGLIFAGVVVVLASVLGLVFLNKIIDKVGMTNIIIIMAVVLMIVFFKFFNGLFMSLLGLIKSVFKV